MTKAIDIAEMKQRVTATEAKLSATAQEGQNCNMRLLNLLDMVEKNLARKQQQISRLEEEHGRALEEILHLRNLLHIMLSMAENTHQRKPHLPLENLDQLFDRLGAIASAMKQDGNENWNKNIEDEKSC